MFGVRNLEAGRALRDYVAPKAEVESSVPAVESEYGAKFRSYLTDADPDAVCVVGANKIGIEPVWDPVLTAMKALGDEME